MPTMMPAVEHHVMDMMLPSSYYPASPSTGMRAPPLVGRSTSYSFIESEMSANRHRFDDVVPAPPPYFSYTMTEVDDLFY